MNAGASTYAVPSPIEGPGTAWVLLGSWALSPARPTPIHPRHECRGFSALLVTLREHAPRCLPLSSKNTDEGFTKWTSSDPQSCPRSSDGKHNPRRDNGAWRCSRCNAPLPVPDDFVYLGGKP